MFVTLRHMGMHQRAGNRRVHRAGSAVLAIAFAAVLSTLGCGTQYRPVVTAIGPVGPAGQPTKFAVAIASPSATSPGLATLVDYSGDTVVSTPQVVSNPSYFVLNTAGSSSGAVGSEAYVVNASGSLDVIPVSNPASLLTSQETQTTLPAGASPISITALTPANGLATVFIPEPATNSISALNAFTTALYDTVSVQGGGSNPVYVVGVGGTPRVYAISQNAPGGNGQVDALETVSTTSLSDSAQIPVGVEPVYGVMTPDDRRAFILNEGSGTVSVLNVPSNALDTLPPGNEPAGTPLGTIPLCSNPSAATPNEPCPGLNPVWADVNSVDTELVVLNQGDGVHPGSLSVINVPLCDSLAQPTNPNCSPTNPVDAASFGQVLATVPVGIDPTPGYGMVSVLQGTDTNTPAAYVINQLDSTGTCGSGEGSITVVNLRTDQVTATICGISGSAATIAANGASNVIFGHPNSISATGGAPTGKVYVTSSDSQYLSVIYTDTNTVQTHIPLQGTGLRVLVTAP